MLKRHFSPKFSGAAAAVMLVAAVWLFGADRPAAMAFDMETGGYTFEGGETVDRPKVFISSDPGEDRIVFEPGARIDADVDYEPEQFEKDFEQWGKWHRETGADPNRIDAYDLKPLGAFTMGRTYDRITLEKGARIVNRGSVGDGMSTLGSVDIDVGQDAVVHGHWTGMALGNFEDHEDDAFFLVNVTNRGTIGTFMEDLGFEPYEKTSQNGVVFYEGVEGRLFNEVSGIIRGDYAGVYTNYRLADEGFDPFDYLFPHPYQEWADEYAAGRAFELENRGAITGQFYGVFEGGGVETVTILNDKTGYIEGSSSGVYLIRGGTVDNRGEIRGKETGIFVGSGTADIIHSGKLTAEDPDSDTASDAIRFGRHAEGGSVALFAPVTGGIRHFGDSADATLSLNAPQDNQQGNAPLSVGDIDFGGGGVIQEGGDWHYNDLFAGTITLESGLMRLDGDIGAGGRDGFGDDVTLTITVEDGATLSNRDGTITARNFINRGSLLFPDGEIAIDGGLFNHAGPEGDARDLGIEGSGKGAHPRFALIGGATAQGIDDLDVGGNYAGTLTLEDDSLVSFENRLAVRSHGLLSGVGTVRGERTEVRAGGTIRPGHIYERGREMILDEDARVLEIDGDLHIHDGAVVDIGIERDYNAEINVSGEAVLDGGTVKVTDYSGFTLHDGSVYTFLTAGEGVTGAFNPAVESFAPMVYEFDLLYQPGAVSFEVIRNADYTDYMMTDNDAILVSAFESAWEQEHLDDLRFDMDSLLNAVLEGKESPDHLVDTIRQLDPEPYQQSLRMAADNATQMNRRFLKGARTSRLQIGTPKQQGGDQGLAGMVGTALALAGDDPAALDRLGADTGMAAIGGLGMVNANASAGASTDRARIMQGELGESIADTGVRFFYGGYRRLGDIDEGPARMGHDYKVRGGFLGFERARNGVISGIGLSYANSEVDFDDDSGNLNMHSLRLGPHATIDRGGLEVDVALNAGYNWNRQKRNMPHIDRQSVVRYNIWDGSVYTGARYNLSFRDRWLLAPSAALQYTHQYRESFTERRAKDARLKLGSDSSDVLRSLLGVTLSREFRGRRAVLVPEIFAGWEHDLLDADMTIDAAFAEAPGSGFRADADGAGKEVFTYGGGVTLLFGEYNAAFVNYELEERDGGDGYIFSAGVKWNF